MKKRIPKVVWITALFLELIIVLIMVMDYKINYQYLKNNKLYFYDCNGTLCVTEVENKSKLLYSVYECGENECPVYNSELNNNYAILSNKDNKILYDYQNQKIISYEYDNYQFINNQYIITSKNEKQGIINLNNEVIVEPSYDQLGYIKDSYLSGYGLNYILAKKNDKYGIISFKTGQIVEAITHSEEEYDKILETIKKDSKTTK